MGKKKTSEEYIEECRKVHGDRYDYSETRYTSYNGKVCIICHEVDAATGKEHGRFWQNAGSHVHGCGCPSCAGLKPLKTDAFIERSKNVHGDRYDYTETEYVNKRTKVKIICPIHGPFWQLPKNHYNGQGCPECGKKYAREYKKGNYRHFLEASRERFGNMYEFPYIEREFENSHSVVTIKCTKCGSIFTKIACDHITSVNGGCGKCNTLKKPGKSAAEIEIGDFLRNLLKGEDVETNNRTVLKGMELDIYIPSRHMAIEYNGVYWHSDEYLPNKNSHLLKTEACEEKGIRLIHIFEDEYLENRELVLDKLVHIVGNSTGQKIMARKCCIREIGYAESKVFLKENHIQGPASSTVYLGAFLEESLVGVMTFRKERRNGNKWELNRFATAREFRCAGIGGKLFSYFVRNYGPEEVKSFADRRWTSLLKENLYEKIGFRFDGYVPPSYTYVIGGKRVHKFNFRKKNLHGKYGLSLTLTESEMAKELGVHRIYDCGLIKYIWKKEN